MLILCEVLRWHAAEVAELLETSVASVNSALQRARATLEAREVSMDATPSVDEADAELLARYVEAFESYDMDALTALIREDARQSMPPYDLWLSGRDDIFTWWFGPGIGCRGSRVVPVLRSVSQTIISRSCSANGTRFNRTASTTLKMAVVAPIPSASVSTAAVVKPAFLPSMRVAYRMSCHRS